MPPETMNPGAELALRDIHLPEPISWWPLAPGWWILLGVVILLLCALIYSVYLWRSKRVLRQLQHELQQLKRTYQKNGDTAQTIKQLSVLLRRAGISYFPRHDVASLTGDNWLNFLDEISHGKDFSKGIGKVIRSGPYQRAQAIDSKQLEALFDLVADTLPQIHSRRKKT